MQTIVLDIETTYTLFGKKKNPSPFLSTNKLVSVGYIVVGEQPIKDYLIFSHSEYEDRGEAKAKLQAVLDKTDLIIGHNLKFDMTWLYETGFSYSGKFYDTMICEYVYAKGLKTALSLAESCKRYDLTAKTDTLSNYFDNNVNTDMIPLSELTAYGMNDIEITLELYNKQRQRALDEPDCAYMQKAINLMNNTLAAIIDIERAGIHIDMIELSKVEKEYRDEMAAIKDRLNATVLSVMGDTPINLDSSEHLSWILYSRKVKDKNLWKDTFNLGTEIRNSVVKVKYARRMKDGEFKSIIRAQTDKLYKQKAIHCEVCNGAGRIRKTKVDGTAFKKETGCRKCEATGYYYVPTTAYAGFKLTPLNSEYVTIGGFSSDKITLNGFLETDISDKAKSFIKDVLRMNAIDTYLKSFVEGIQKNVYDNILHTSFNQCLTATGRLSSSNPNFQNLPRGSTFPVRRVITSRWIGGKILSVDFKQLEFRVAAILAKDEQAYADIEAGIDVHIFTRDTITAAGQPMDRQAAKIRTFKPLYGGIRGTPAEEAYYKAFLLKYKGIDAWQKQLENEALYTKQIKSPSGRIYSFPLAARMPNGTVKGHTQIKNYIVQGFATGDINPIALINIWELMTALKLKSRLILTVHDDITADVHPDEVDQMINIFKVVFKSMNDLVKDAFGIETPINIEGDFSIGDNWLDKKEIAA